MMNIGPYTYPLAVVAIKIGYPVNSGHRRYGVPHGDTDHEGAAVGCLIVLGCILATALVLVGGVMWLLWEMMG